MGSALHQLILPSLTLGLSVMAPIARMVRSTMLEILESDYIKAAWAAGIPRRRVIYGDALANAMIPVVTILGIVFGFLMAGNAVVGMYVCHGTLRGLTMTGKTTPAAALLPEPSPFPGTLRA